MCKKRQKFNDFLCVSNSNKDWENQETHKRKWNCNQTGSMSCFSYDSRRAMSDLVSLSRSVTQRTTEKTRRSRSRVRLFLSSQFWDWLYLTVTCALTSSESAILVKAASTLRAWQTSKQPPLARFRRSFLDIKKREGLDIFDSRIESDCFSLPNIINHKNVSESNLAKKESGISKDWLLNPMPSKVSKTIHVYIITRNRTIRFLSNHAFSIHNLQKKRN
jgi:hypothetical protein